MPGFTRLENDTDLKTVLALPAVLQGPFLFLFSRRNFRSKGVKWSEIADACGLSRTTTFRLLAILKTRGLVLQSQDSWSLEIDSQSPNSGTREEHESPKNGIQSPNSGTRESQKRNFRVPKMGLLVSNEVVQHDQDSPSKEVEVKRTEGTEGAAKREISKEKLPETPETLTQLDGFTDAWAAYLEMRSKHKKHGRITPRVAAMAFKKLTGFAEQSIDPVEIVERSALSGWANFYVPDANRRTHALEPDTSNHPSRRKLS